MTRSFQELQEVFQREPSMRLPGFPYMSRISRPVYEQYRASGMITDADEKVLFRPLAMWAAPIFYTSALTALFLMRMPRRLGFRNHRWFMPAIDGLAVLLFVQPAVALETRLLLDDRRRVLDAVRLMQEESRRRWSMDPPEKGKVPVLPPPGREAQQPPVLPPPGREEPWWGAENEGGPEREPDDAWAGGGQSEKRKNELSEFDWRPR